MTNCRFSVNLLEKIIKCHSLESYTPFPLVWHPPLAIPCTAVEGRGQRNPMSGKKACMSVLHILLT